MCMHARPHVSPTRAARATHTYAHARMQVHCVEPRLSKGTVESDDINPDWTLKPLRKQFKARACSCVARRRRLHVHLRPGPACMCVCVSVWLCA